MRSVATRGLGSSQEREHAAILCAARTGLTAPARG